MFYRIIRYSFYSLFVLVPLVFLPNTSELFEFNKIIITYVFTGIIAAAWLSRMIVNKRWIFRRTLLDIPLILFLVINLLSLMFSIDHHTAWFGYYSRWNGGLSSLIAYALLYWAFVSNMTSSAVKRTLQLALGASFLVSLWGIAEHFGVDADIWVQDVKSRVFSTIGQPNWLAAYLVAIIFVPISNVLMTKNQGLGKTSWHIALATILFITLLFTRSRSGLLAFGISSFVYWGILFWKTKKESLKPIIIFAGIVGLLSLILPNPGRDLFFKTSPTSAKPNTDTQLEVGGSESGNIRKIVWTGAIRIWQGSTKNFLLGTGPDTFAMAYYQYRPIEHNQTTEWELLYNKAHNEFLNYLATTGILGLGSYLLLLTIMFVILVKNVRHSTSGTALSTALLAGWLTIPITNFLGFSVVLVQILLFLLPAMAITLSDTKKDLEDAAPSGEQIMGIILLCALPLLIFLIMIARYWYADTLLSSSQKRTKSFQATQEPQYLLLAYQDATAAYKINNKEPVIALELSNSAAYLSLALINQSTASATQLAQISLATSQQAIDVSPFHPNYYKSRARSLILLSDLDPRYLEEAARTLKQAMLISPTDPRLPFNLGVVYKYLDQMELAKQMFQKALLLKSDFADPQKQLDTL